jgi:1-deoxy-D-xylulose-5-phosphate reductoisomerase
MKKIAILGSTGSIGVNALDVIRRNPKRYKVIALSAGRNVRLLKKQIDQYQPKIVSVIDGAHAERLKSILKPPHKTKIVFGSDGYRELATLKETNTVISAIVGSGGLIPTIEAISAGKDIALANKETMVMAGNIVVEKAKEKGVRIMPIDSEHSAIFQCLAGQKRESVKRIILTASGGPFLNFKRKDLERVKPSDALEHPNWKMGKKVTIDSASLMNKGLEIIEAKWLFGIDMENIDVHIHPQSIVHSMVEFIDGSVMAQLSIPDMRIPIAYALSYPYRISEGRPLNLFKIRNLEFLKPDVDRFPNLRLAYEAGKAGGTSPAVLNAANEVVVEAFLHERVKFMDMPIIIESILSSHQSKPSPSLKEILNADLWAKNQAKQQIERMNNKCSV